MRASRASAQALKGVAFTPQEFREDGFLAGDLRLVGFTIDELKAVGYGVPHSTLPSSCLPSS